MTTPRFVMAALAASFLSTAAVAAPPSASQVSVPAGTAEAHRQSKMMALFDSPGEFMMFRIQMHQATHGMPRDQKKAYRKGELQKIKAMTAGERGAYLHQLQVKWDQLPADRRAKFEAKMERHAERHAENGGHHGHRHMNRGEAQPDDQGSYQNDQQMDQSR
jgi:hypothetical protein